MKTKYSAPVSSSLTLITQVLASLPIPLTTALYSVSFAVIVYGASLSSFLDIGISLALIGSAAAVFVTAFAGSLNGTISHAQDATALLLAGAIAPMVAGLAGTHSEEVQFATVLAFVAVATFLTGLVIYFGGRYKLSFVARFMPYPVISGLLVSIGYLLSIGSIGLVTHQNVSILVLPELVLQGALWPWVPWAIGAALMIFGNRFLSTSRVLPLGLFLGLCLFYGLLAVSQISLSEAETNGLLLGPFPTENRLGQLSPEFFAQVDWASVFNALPAVLALVPMAAVSGILNIQGIAQAKGSHHDLDQDVRAMGLANIASGTVGGLICYPAVSTTLLGRHLKIPNLLMLGTTVAICLAFAVFGTAILGLLPRGLFAMIVLYLGLGLLAETILKDARRLPVSDFMIVLAILATTAFFGVFPALIAGIIFSVCIFIVSYARLPFLRTDTSLSVRRSIVERSELHRVILDDEGQTVRVLELTGSLFFGTAFALRRHIQTLVEAEDTRVQRIILDLRSVRDIDTSALFSLERTFAYCANHGVEIWLCGVRKTVKDRLTRFASVEGGLDLTQLRIFDTLDVALQKAEAEILENHYASGRVDTSDRLLWDELVSVLLDGKLTDVLPIIEIQDGQTIIRQGETSDEIYILLEGKAVAFLEDENDEVMIVARFEQGALIGEIAYYLGAPRTATVNAVGKARLIRVDLAELEASGQISERLITTFHIAAAKYLAQRLSATTRLLRSLQR